MKKISYSNIYNFLILITISFFLGGCAANYFPLKNTNYYPIKDRKTAIIMPYDINIVAYLSNYNTKEVLEKKRELAMEFAEDSFPIYFPRADVEIVDYIPFEKVKENELDFHTMTVISEISNELSNAKFSIKKNLKDEKGKNFDYSIGSKANDIKEISEGDPDLIVFVNISGYVQNLRALEDSGLNTVAAILSLGMTKAFPTSEDIIQIEMTVVDSKTGDIIWLDSVWLYGSSLLQERDTSLAISKIIEKFDQTKL